MGLTNTRFRVFAFAGLAIGLVFLLPVIAYASDIVEGFTSGNRLPSGVIVASTVNEETEVELAGSGNADRIVGVISNQQDGLLTFTSRNTDVYVATSGTSQVYVSDLNGEIRQGDYITASPIKGVGMAADDTTSFVVGVALADYDVNNSTATTTVTDRTGGTKEVRIGKLQMEISPRNITVGESNQRQVFVSFLGEAVAGKPVSQTQVVVAMLLFFVLLVLEGSILYGSIYSSVISIGRNPLARRAVYKNLAQVGGISIIVLLVGLGAIYVVLTI